MDLCGISPLAFFPSFAFTSVADDTLLIPCSCFAQALLHRVSTQSMHT